MSFAGQGTRLHEAGHRRAKVEVDLLRPERGRERACLCAGQAAMCGRVLGSLVLLEGVVGTPDGVSSAPSPRRTRR